MRVTRFNFARTTRGVRPTPQGGLCVEAAVARTGVLQYSAGSGRTWLEYRPESEMFAADDVRRDGDFVVADLLVQDGELCRKVDAGERREVSCGYTCEVDPTPGVTPEGDRYDAVQRNIRHNHVALLAPGEGRSGPEVALRMDGAAVEVRRDAAGESMKIIKLEDHQAEGGREIKLDAAEDPAAAQGAVDEIQQKADEGGETIAACEAAQAALTDAMTQIAVLSGKLKAAEAAKEAPPAVTEDMVPDEVLDAALVKRIALHDEARKVLGASALSSGRGQNSPTHVACPGTSQSGRSGSWRGAVPAKVPRCFPYRLSAELLRRGRGVPGVPGRGLPRRERAPRLSRRGARPRPRRSDGHHAAPRRLRRLVG